jgi:hypothetical protein
MVAEEIDCRAMISWPRPGDQSLLCRTSAAESVRMEYPAVGQGRPAEPRPALIALLRELRQLLW